MVHHPIFNLIRIGFVALLATSSLAMGELKRDGNVAAELVAESDTVPPGSTINAALRLVHDDHWHTYWINPGTGYPTTIDWNLPDGVTVSEFQWPTPKVYEQAGLINYVYEGEVLLPFTITVSDSVADGTSLDLSGTADWLMCDENTCVPGNVAVALNLKVSKSSPQPGTHASTIAETLAKLPKPSEQWQAAAQKQGSKITLQVQPNGTTHKPADLYFFSLDATIASDPPQTFTQSKDGIWSAELVVSDFAPEPIERLKGVLSSSNGWGGTVQGKGIELDVALGKGLIAVGGSTASPEAASINFAQILLFAFVGGLILNLMPCVFPVLGIKIMGFVNKAGEDAIKIKLHGLIYTLGILISFWILAGVLISLRAGGEELGWGFQLQEPAFVFFLTLILLLFGLNLSGVFEIGLSATGVGSNLSTKSGYSGSFFSGVLATVVSTPCAAPFLAPALGAALALAPTQSILVFTMIGLGLASPYLLLSVFPSLVRFLPKPGAWMESFKQAMAFPMYAAAALLVWVLAGQVSEDGLLFTLLALVMAAVAAWLYGRWAQNASKANWRWFGRLSATAMIVAACTLGFPRKPSEFWQTWTPEKVATLREQGKPVYIDFTARWCTTCRTNKATVFQATDRVKQAFKEQGVVALKADWTNKDPQIAAALETFGRAAVPLNILYLPDADEPIILPEILTPDIVLNALYSDKGRYAAK